VRPYCISGSGSYPRLIEYDFTDINCLVQFEADGYLPNSVPGLKTMENHDPETENEQVEGLLTSLKGMIASCQHIPQSAVFGPKARSSKRIPVDNLGDELAWL
jgi:hypothetical protein